jgi:hypothetical protein
MPRRIGSLFSVVALRQSIVGKAVGGVVETVLNMRESGPYGRSGQGRQAGEVVMQPAQQRTCLWHQCARIRNVEVADNFHNDTGLLGGRDRPVAMPGGKPLERDISAAKKILGDEPVVVQVERQAAQPLLSAPRTCRHRAANAHEYDAREKNAQPNRHADPCRGCAGLSRVGLKKRLVGSPKEARKQFFFEEKKSC